MSRDPALRPLQRLVGTWSTEATHPAVPGVVVRGTATFEWLEGERFLVYRHRCDHPDFPDSIAVLGFTDQGRAEGVAGAEADGAERPLRMHYFDSRDVSRVYEVGADDASWRLSRDDPGFSQRFVGAYADGGDTLAGTWQVCRGEGGWEDDLKIAYRRG